jgi:hypothetical protein
LRGESPIQLYAAQRKVQRQSCPHMHAGVSIVLGNAVGNASAQPRKK